MESKDHKAAKGVSDSGLVRRLQGGYRRLEDIGNSFETAAGESFHSRLSHPRETRDCWS